MKSIAAIVVREIREALPAIAFFFVMFHMVALTKVVALSDYSITALSATGATVGALVVAKAILLVDALPLPRWLAGGGIARVAWKTCRYAAVVLVFRVLEELIPLLMKHEGLTVALRALATEVSWPLFGVVALWIVTGLFLYCLTSELVSALGADTIRQALRHPGSKSPHAGGRVDGGTK